MRLFRWKILLNIHFIFLVFVMRLIIPFRLFLKDVSDFFIYLFFILFFIFIFIFIYLLLSSSSFLSQTNFHSKNTNTPPFPSPPHTSGKPLLRNPQNPPKRTRRRRKKKNSRRKTKNTTNRERTAISAKQEFREICIFGDYD